MNLQGKTVLITGSSRGIGKSIAQAFGHAGCNVVINGSKDQEALTQTKLLLESEGISVLDVFIDVSSYENCQSLFHTIADVFGCVDILVNNAGISYIGLFSHMNPTEYKQLLEVNTLSAFHCTHLAIPTMIHKKSGCIINISSIWGELGASCEVVYSATKGALNSFTKAMAKELGPSNVRVNAIACGVIDTQMNHCFTEEEKQSLAEENSLMRFGTTKEVADLALFLASENASFLTGQVITLDGGI